MKNRKKQKNNVNQVMDETKQAKMLLNEGKNIFQKAVCDDEVLQALEMFSKAINKSLNAQVLHLNHIYHYRGLCQFQLKDYDSAERDFQEAIRISDDKSRVQFYNSLGKCKVEMSVYDPTYLEEAIKCFEHAKSFSNNSDGQAYFNLGNIYRKKKLIIQAIKNYDSASKILKGHDLFQVYINRGLCYRDFGELDNSIEDMKRACDIGKDNPLAHFHLGANYLLSANYESALQKFNTAIQMDQLEPKFQNYKGLALYLNEQYQACLAVFKQALKLYTLRDIRSAEVGQCWYNTGNALLHLQRQIQALQAFEKGLQCDNIDKQMKVKIYYAQGRAYESQGQQIAIQKFEECISTIGLDKSANDLYLSALFHLGKNQHKFKYYTDAIESFSQIIAFQCNDKCVYQARGNAYMDAQQYDLALKDFQMVVSFDENYPEVYNLIGLSKTHLNDIENALQDFFHAVQIGSRNIAVFNGISYAYLMSGKYEKALIYSNIALEKQPKNEQFLIQRSRIYIQLDDNNKGIQDLSLALEVNSKNAIIYYRRGLAYYKNKDYELAISDLQLSLEHSPSKYIISDIYYHLGISFSNLQKYRESIQPLSNAILKDSKAKYFHQRAKSYLLLEQNQEALHDFNQVISLQPQNAFAYFRRAFANKALKKYEEAAEDFSKAREISPQDPRLIINKKQIYQIKYRKLCEPGQQQ